MAHRSSPRHAPSGPLLIEGFTPEEINNLPDEQIESLVITGEPIVFQAGSARVLGEFRLSENRLTVELAQIEGGGEGVLLTLWLLVEQYVTRRGLEEMEWIVHAVDCAEPNLKLRRVLQRRGFVVQDVPGIGTAYYYRQRVSDETSSSAIDAGDAESGE
jgi:hypothetical protein